MKKIIIVFVILLSITVTAQEQTGKFFFYVQGGYKSAGYIRESILKEIISEKETNHHKCIILNAGLLLKIAENWRLGPAFTYDHFGTKYRSVEFSNINYMLRNDRIWKETKNYLFYSGISFGIRKIRKFKDETEVDRWVKPAYHIFLAGLELKAGHFIIDANAGYGVSGILNFGMQYRF